MRIKMAYVPALVMNLKVWTVLQYLNVKYIPQQVSHLPLPSDIEEDPVFIFRVSSDCVFFLGGGAPFNCPSLYELYHIK